MREDKGSVKVRGTYVGVQSVSWCGYGGTQNELIKCCITGCGHVIKVRGACVKSRHNCTFHCL